MKGLCVKVCVALMALILQTGAWAQVKSDTLYVFLNNGNTDIFPRALLQEEEWGEQGLRLVTLGGVAFEYENSDIKETSDYAHVLLPKLLSFKLNNKFNDELYKDVECTITGDSLIEGTVIAIGRWVTPSFKLSNKKGVVLLDSVVQKSKRSKVYVDGEKWYCVTAPGVRILTDSAGTEVLKPYEQKYRVALTWKTEATKAVPCVYLNTVSGENISSKTEYVEAMVELTGAKVFGNMASTNIQVKGRGNTSWSNTPTSKNPYNIKFSEGVKPFGMKKGKKWVLQANRQTGSMMTNPIAMKMARLVGAEGANDYLPVELYVNQQYWGSYGFTEKVGLAGNSIDLEDESKAVLLELDTYYDADYKFKSTPYSLPVNVKDPDLSDTEETSITLTDVKAAFNKLTEKVQAKEDISDVCDIDALARFFFVNEYTTNGELNHPKSMYLYCENIYKTKPVWKFGPVWDFDWAYGYNKTATYCDDNIEKDYFDWSSGNGRQFIKDLRNGCEAVDRAMYKVWTNFIRDDLQELLDFCDAYYAFAKSSFKNNKSTRGDKTDYEAWTAKAKDWLEQRAIYVYSTLTPYELTEEELYGSVEGDDEEGVPFVTPAEAPIIDAVERIEKPIEPTRFDVYNANGVCVKRSVKFNEIREGLPSGLYIVNGKKMLIND